MMHQREGQGVKCASIGCGRMGSMLVFIICIILYVVWSVCGGVCLCVCVWCVCLVCLVVYYCVGVGWLCVFGVGVLYYLRGCFVVECVGWWFCGVGVWNW